MFGRLGALQWVGRLCALGVIGAASVPRAFAADNFEAWRQLHDALLDEALDGDLTASSAEYERMVRNAGAGDPLRGAALYWLGRARWQGGDVAGAREALREGVRAGSARNACLELLDQIELDQSAVRTTPVRWSFDDSAHGLVHPWWYRDNGSIRVANEAQSGPALAWTTRLDARRDDQLHLAVDRAKPVPERVRFIVWSEAEEVAIRLIFVNEDGQRYAPRAEAALIRVQAGAPLLVDQPLAMLTPLDPDSPPFAPAGLSRIILQDVTAFYTQGSGERTILIDDFELF